MFVIIISCVLVLLSLLYDYVKNKRKFDLIEKFPGPVTQPIVGNAFNYTAKSAEGKSFHLKTDNLISAQSLFITEKRIKFMTQTFIHFQM